MGESAERRPVANQLVAELQSRFDGIVSSEFRGQVRIDVACETALSLMTVLKQEFEYQALVDIPCEDYFGYRGAECRFGVVYMFATMDTNERLAVRVMVDEPDPQVDSLTHLWAGADWLEREVWDMFGIGFRGHPGLRRILMPEEFAAFPLRKDYPLQGRGERHNFPVLTRGEA